MRRTDREITDPKTITAIIRRCDCCRVGFAAPEGVYIVPLSFGYEEAEGRRTFYFHGAPEGRKFDLIQSCPTVGFELDTDYALHETDSACGYSCRFQSVIGTGVIRPVTDPAEKRQGLACIMDHLSGRADWDFPDQAVRSTAVFRLDVADMTCKAHA
ncbi:MAG: pyridoxamine 5'-phosphate oxidase family protein [Oscillospiraceae bacterium]|nr:pyridoxamine 5'-phosphate oxidase family protein [Oscillospiraceae bacterium]